MIEVIYNINALDKIRENWERLFSKSHNIIFQSFNYTRLSWEFIANENYKNRLHILLSFNKKNELIAIFPFYIDHHSTLRFINDKHTDFCDLIIDSNPENHYSIFEELSLYIINCSLIKSIKLINICPSSPLIPYLKIFNKNAFIYSSNEYSYVCLKKAINILDVNFTYLNSHRRKALNSIIRKKGEYDLKVFRKDIDMFPEVQLNYLIKIMVDNKSRSKSYFNNNFLNFIRECYDLNLIEIPILFNSNLPISLGITFINEYNTYLVRWIILYVEPKYNLWNNILYMDFKSSENDLIMNFGRGAYDYKMKNFKPIVENLYNIVYSKSLFGKLKFLFLINFNYIYNIINK